MRNYGVAQDLLTARQNQSNDFIRHGVTCSSLERRCFEGGNIYAERIQCILYRNEFILVDFIDV